MSACSTCCTRKRADKHFRRPDGRSRVGERGHSRVTEVAVCPGYSVVDNAWCDAAQPRCAFASISTPVLVTEATGATVTLRASAPPV
jgi:hypothetical protein